MQVLLLVNLKAQNIITTVAGNGIQGYTGDNGLATTAKLKNPVGLAFDKSGNLYIADVSNNCVRKVNTSGIITTVAGTGISGYSGDNGPATSAQLYMPYGLVFDKSNNLYIADFANNRVRKINSSGIITTIAGTGVSGYNGDGVSATAAKLNAPIELTFDTSGNLYIAEQANYRIRKINTSGIITTIAGTGTGGYNGDGIVATTAQISNPVQITFDIQGNLYFADGSNNRVRMINTSGIISTVAGTGTAGYSGDNALAISAQLSQPVGIVCDVTGNIYFSDQNNHRIRKINTSGIITTIAGNGTSGYNGDNISATAAQLYYPEGITFDTLGNLYIADNYNNRIRKVTNVAVGIQEQTASNQQLNIFPNPNSGSFTINSSKGKQLSAEIYNMFGQQVLKKTFTIANTMQVEGLTEGVYLVKIIIDGVLNKTERIIVTK